MDDGQNITLGELKKQYPVGAMVELVKMEDRDSPPVGTRGKVLHVDALKTVHVLWENGSTLGIVVAVDKIRLVSDEWGNNNG